MEVLIALVSSLFLQAVKWLSDKVGKKATKNVILLLLFALSLVFVLVTEQNWVSVEALEKFVALVLMAIGVYEGLLMRLGPFLLGKAKLLKAKVLKK